MGQPVIHIVNFPLLGHVISPNSVDAPDCWCEPSRIYWVRDKNNVNCMVIEHNDYDLRPRHVQLADQERGHPEQLAWINHALYNPESYPVARNRDWPPPLLPPSERDL